MDAEDCTVGVVARLTGVSVRTLHHYDAVGLLEPGQRNAVGYRLYSPEDRDQGDGDGYRQGAVSKKDGRIPDSRSAAGSLR